jgi:hypothetical protein
MNVIGLYYPRIHFPSDAWIKVAALYWTKMARIVPREYTPRDSETVRMLRDELNFIVDVHPPLHQEDSGACDIFRHFIYRNHAELHKRYAVKGAGFTQNTRHPMGYPFDFESWNDAHGEPLVAEVAEEKVAWSLRRELVSHGLAFAKPASERHEFFYDDVPSSLLMHPNLARVYMSALAEDIARENHLCPTTDDPGVYAASTGWTIDRMSNLLLPPSAREIPDPEFDTLEWRVGGPDPIGMLAIRAVIPRDIDHIPTQKIIKIRKTLTPYFIAFRNAVNTIEGEIRQQLERIQDTAIIRAYLEQEVHEKLLTPVKELRNEMRHMKIDTTTATLTFKYEVPALAGLIAGGVLAHDSLLAGGAAAAVGLLGLIRGHRHNRATYRAHSPVSYLMLLEDQLGARSALDRAARQIRKITGLT